MMAASSRLGLGVASDGHLDRRPKSLPRILVGFSESLPRLSRCPPRPYLNPSTFVFPQRECRAFSRVQRPRSPPFSRVRAKTAYCRKAGKHINLIRPSDKCMQSMTSYIKQIYNLIWYVPPKLVGPCNSLLSKAPWRPKKRLPRRLRRQRRALLAPGRWSRQFSLRRAAARAMAAKAHTTTCHASLRRTDVLLVVGVAHKCTQQWV